MSVDFELPPPFVVALAEEEDLWGVFEIEQRCFGKEAWGVCSLRDCIERHTMWVALNERSKVVGYIVMYVKERKVEDSTHDDDGNHRNLSFDCNYISSLGVHPEWRRQGIARLLLNYQLHQNHTFASNNTTVLHVRADNRGAIRLYESLGFVFYRVAHWTYSDGECALMYVRRQNNINATDNNPERKKAVSGEEHGGKVCKVKIEHEREVQQSNRLHPQHQQLQQQQQHQKQRRLATSLENGHDDNDDSNSDHSSDIVVVVSNRIQELTVLQLEQKDIIENHNSDDDDTSNGDLASSIDDIECKLEIKTGERSEAKKIMVTKHLQQQPQQPKRCLPLPDDDEDSIIDCKETTFGTSDVWRILADSDWEEEDER
eukprot:m.205574 g.205574  ORF g.205574 m.205574 type:complete len:373 (-) comp13749_c0_seq1:5515-6633(-)